MSELPPGIVIVAGILHFGGQNVFLRNVTSTRIEVAESLNRLNLDERLMVMVRGAS